MCPSHSYQVKKQVWIIGEDETCTVASVSLQPRIRDMTAHSLHLHLVFLLTERPHIETGLPLVGPSLLHHIAAWGVSFSSVKHLKGKKWTWGLFPFHWKSWKCFRSKSICLLPDRFACGKPYIIIWVQRSSSKRRERYSLAFADPVCSPVCSIVGALTEHVFHV
jgi:hypothetical protein